MPANLYKPEYAQTIISGDYVGKHMIQIASMMGIHKDTLYEWARVHPEFKASMRIAKQNHQSKLLDIYDQYVTTTDKERFYDKAVEFRLRIAGLGRSLERLNGVKNESEALQTVQDALSDDEIDTSYSETLTKIIMAKVEAKKVLELEENVKQLKAKLGIE